MTTDRIKEILNKALSSPLIKRKYPFIENIYVRKVEEKVSKPGNYNVVFHMYCNEDYNYSIRDRIISDLYDLLDNLGIGEFNYNHVFLLITN